MVIRRHGSALDNSFGVPVTAPNKLVSVVLLRGDCELRAAWKLDDEVRPHAADNPKERK